MAMIHNKSIASVCSQADLFSLPSTDTSIDASLYSETKPLVNIQDSNAKIEFRIIGSPTHYLDCFDSFLWVKFKLVKPDGKTDLATGDDISTSNAFLHSMFSDVEIFLNNQLESNCNGCYPYKAYFKLLNEYVNGNPTDLECAMFHLDTDNCKLNDSNLGYKKRKELVKESTEVELIGKLFFDLSEQSRFILNDTEMTITLTRAKDEFCILAPDAKLSSNPVSAKLKILDASYVIRRHILYPSITLSHNKLLEMGNPVKYPMIENKINFFTIPKANQSFQEDNIFNGLLPSRVILGLVSNSSFVGDFLKNPFNFLHEKINSVTLMVNSMPIPCRPLNVDFVGKQSKLAYYLLNKCVSKINDNKGLMFDYNNYLNGFTFFGFDINPIDLTDSRLHLEKSGSVKIELKFTSSLSEACTLIIYSEHQKVLELDKTRRIITQ